MDSDSERSATPLVPLPRERAVVGVVAEEQSRGGGDSADTEKVWNAIVAQIQNLEERMRKEEKGEEERKTNVRLYLGSCLRTAAKKNMKDIIQKLLAETKVQVDPNDKDSRGWTSFMIAGMNGCTAIVQMLLDDSRFDLELKDKNELTILHHAAKHNKHEVVKLLVEDGRLDPNVKTAQGITPLMLACMEGWVQVVDQLLGSTRLDVNCADPNGDTALLHAAVKGHEDIVQRLLQEKNIDINKANNNGDTALMCASNEPHAGVVRTLLTRDDLEVNASNTDGYTALMCGADKGSKEVVESLIRHPNIDLNLADQNGDNALMWAVDKSHIDIVSMMVQRETLDKSDKNTDRIVNLLLDRRRMTYEDILEAVVKAVKNLKKPEIALWLLRSLFNNADIKNVLNEDGHKNLHDLLIFSAQEGFKDMVDVLLNEEGLLNVDVRDDTNNTPLLHAVNSNRPEAYQIVKKLLEMNCDVNAQGIKANTALLRACDKHQKLRMKHHEDIVRLLVYSNADVNVTNYDNDTPLNIAAEGNDGVVVEILLGVKEIDVNKKGYEGKSALILASEKGHDKVVRKLLACPGIDTNVQDGGGYTALMWAADMVQVRRVCLLTVSVCHRLVAIIP